MRISSHSADICSVPQSNKTSIISLGRSYLLTYRFLSHPILNNANISGLKLLIDATERLFRYRHSRGRRARAPGRPSPGGQRQSRSSVSSTQSWWPSHRKSFGMHRVLSHRKPSTQAGAAGKQSLLLNKSLH